MVFTNGPFNDTEKEWLNSRVPGYIAAVKDNSGGAYVSGVIRAYFKVWSPKKGKDYTPTPEEIEAVDENSPDEELVRPVRKEGQSEDAFRKEEEEFIAMTSRVAQRVKVCCQRLPSC